MARSANTNPMPPTSEKVDHGAVRLARKKANISNYTTNGTNTAKTGVSLSRPTAKKAAAANPHAVGQPVTAKRAGKLNRRKRTS